MNRFWLRPHPSLPRRWFRLLVAVATLAIVASACGSDDVAFDGVPAGSTTLVEERDVEFIEISPFATFGSAIGDFGEGSHGTFGIFGAGAASPPHTHSGSYYAVVLSGEMNNPFGTETDPPVLAPGSFWAVPGTDEHVTACLTPDQECRFFFHADGAFDFMPIEAMTEERTSGSAAIPAQDLRFRALEPYSGAATVWGDPGSGPYGSMVRLAAGDDTGELAYRNPFTIVPVTGDLTLESEDRALLVGSVLRLDANAVHSLSCGSGTDCTFYTYSADAREIRS